MHIPVPIIPIILNLKHIKNTYIYGISQCYVKYIDVLIVNYWKIIYTIVTRLKKKKKC